MTGAPTPTPRAAEVRTRLVETLRRDLIGPSPQNTGLALERLGEKPSGWYVTGYLAPLPEPEGPSAETAEQDDLLDEGDPQVGADRGADSDTGPARAADDAPDDEAPVVRIRAPSSVGLTVLLDASVQEVEVNLSWGDYVTVPPLSPRSCSTRRWRLGRWIGSAYLAARRCRFRSRRTACATSSSSPDPAVPSAPPAHCNWRCTHVPTT